MKLNFWVQASLQTALAFAAAAVDNTKASPEQKTAAENLFAAGQQFLAAFSSH